MVTIEEIAKKTKMKESEVKKILKQRGISPHKGDRYASIDLERVFDENFKVREANAPVLRTLETHQEIVDKQ